MGSVESGWLPLGSAQVIDWKYLGRPASARGAAAWATRIDGEPLLLRTWTNEATTYYEFQFLAFEDLHGTIVVSTSRPETSRLRLLITVDVEGRLGYSDSSEFREHARTGLFGATVRTVDVTTGNLDADKIAAPTAAQAEIFEYAPESALHTACGAWFTNVFSAMRAQLLDGADGDDEVPEIKPASKPLPAPTPIKKEAPAPVKAAPPIVEEDEEEEEPAPELEDEDELELADDEPVKPVITPPKPSSTGQGAARRARETMDAPAPSLAPAKQDVRREPLPAPEKPKKGGVGKLRASTNAGDNWDLNDPETFIGRSKQCAVVLKSQRVSRKHASITKEDDGFYINDLGAANGIWVGTEKIDREKIEDGSEYIIGDVLVTFTYA
jgi:hypothetical protein